MPATTRSSAASKSSIRITSRWWRPAKIAASLQMLARSAPVRPLVWRATSSRSTFCSGLFLECTRRISWRPARSGGGTKIWRSKRPGRGSAGSSFSSRLEAAITTSSSEPPKPSISTSSWLSVWSFSPEMSCPRVAPTASSSSMKTMAGRALRASRNRRRMRAAPRPANISTNDDADCAKNLAFDSFATALASNVLPVPGGPCSRMPRGTLAPSRRKRLGSRRKSTTSRSSSFASSTPATSSHLIASDDSGVIRCGFVRGMYRSVSAIRATMAPMKMIGSQVSAQFSKPSRKVPRRGVIRTCNRPLGSKSLLHNLQSGVRPLTAAHLGAFSPVDDHDVSGEIVLSSEQGGPHAVGVHRHALRLERADALGIEPARDDDLHLPVAGGVKGLAHTLDEDLVDPGGTEVTHLMPQRTIDQALGGVEPDAPEVVAEGLGYLERRPHGVILEVHEHGDVHLAGEVPGERLGRFHGAAVVGGDQRMRDGADAAAAPPRCLRVRGHADGAGHVRCPAVAGLHEPVVVARGEEEDLFAARRLHHLVHVPHHERAAGEAAEGDGLEVCEQRVVALDRHHGLLRGDLVAFVQRVDREVLPGVLEAPVRRVAAGALLQHGDRLVDPAQHRFLLLEHLHHHLRVPVLGLEQL